MDTVSVIVAAYNVQEYIERCVTSLREQTYRNIEIILVDDGSNDNTGKLCDLYSELDNRIISLHKKNGGLSSARNYGIKKASGNYIAFVDGDDWVENDFVEVLYTNLIKEHADLSIIGYTMVWDNGKKKCNTSYQNYQVWNQHTALHELFAQEKIGCMAWQRLYKRKIFESICFPEGKLFEDVAIAVDVFRWCEKIVWCGASKYNYFQRTGSIVNSQFNIKKLYMLESCQKMIDFSYNIGGEFDNETNAFYLKAAMMLMMQAYGSKRTKETENAKKNIRDAIKKHNKYILRNQYLNLTKKIILILIQYKFIPERVLYKIWKKHMER